MNKYLFETYETRGNERVFKGYKSVRANNNAEARELVLQIVDEGVTVFQVYIPQDSE
jgi:hypothetical protein